MRAKREGRRARIIDDAPIETCPYKHPSFKHPSFKHPSFKRVYWRAAWMKADKEMTALGWPHGYKAEWENSGKCQNHSTIADGE